MRGTEEMKLKGTTGMTSKSKGGGVTDDNLPRDSFLRLTFIISSPTSYSRLLKS